MGLIRFIRNQIRHDRNIRKLMAAQHVELEEIHSLIEKSRLDRLKEQVLHSKEMGVSQVNLCEHEVVVSLTSFGRRIFDVSLAIESIMQGTVKPNRIVLWLSEEEFKGKQLPKVLEMQVARGLQVEYCEDIRSYKKLIPALRMYPEACIITIDDDAMYDYDLVERLVAASRAFPSAVCASRIHKVVLNNDGRPKSYLDWNWCAEEYGSNSNLLFPTTGGGTLFPPGCFPQEVFNQGVFMDLCPNADDVWFYSMLLLNNTRIIQVYTGNPNGYYMDLRSGDIDSLGDDNFRSDKCLNDVQLKAVFDRYDLYQKLMV